MVSHYTLPNFVRQASNRLLIEYFTAASIGLDLKEPSAQSFEPIVAAIGRLKSEKRNQLDRDFMEVSSLSDRAGIQQIIEEAHFRGVEFVSDLQAQNSFLNKAFWTFLHHQQVFLGAARFAARFTRGRYWKRGLPLPGRPVVAIGDKIADLEAALSAYFQKEEGRGSACQIEYSSRGPIHFLHAYPEDFPAAPQAWSATGLAPHPFRPAFDVIFAYDNAANTLDIYFEGGKKSVERLWALFANVVFGIQRLPEIVKPSYDLELLKAPAFALKPPEGGRLIEVRAKRLAFRIVGEESTVITVETDVSKDPGALDAAVRRVFNAGAGQPTRYSLADTEIVGVTYQATIDSGDGTRPRTRTFDVSKGSTSLRYDDTDLLLRRMLLDSGIDQSHGRIADDAERGRPTPQRAAG